MKRFTLTIVASGFFGVTSINAQIIERSQLPSANLGAPLPVSPFGTMSYPLFPSATTWHGSTKSWGYGSPYGNVIPSIAFLADDDKGAPKSCTNGSTWNKHLGTDYAAPAGTKVYAIADGIIKRINTFSSKIVNGKSVSVGDYFLVVESGNNEKWTTLYGHLEKPPAWPLLGIGNLDMNVSIKKGDLIGTLFNYRESGDIPHLHLGIRLSPYANVLFSHKDSSTRGYACLENPDYQLNKFKFTSPEQLRFLTNYY